MITLADAAAWMLTDQTRHASLWLSSIDCRLPMQRVFKGVQGESA